MNSNLVKIAPSLWFALLVVCFTAGSASAASFHLRAAAGTKIMPDGTAVPIWGFGLYSTAAAPAPSVPGPVLTTTPNDPVTITVTNDLPVPVSVVIPGQPYTVNPAAYLTSPSDPVGVNKPRVVSFTNQVAPGATVAYAPFNARPGTYLYESGTNPATQISMGLYGALVIAPAGLPALAYPTTPSTTITVPQRTYNRDAVVLFSEILARFDKPLNRYVTFNEEVVGGTARSTLDYAPLYFLINGNSYPDNPEIVAVPGELTLLRLINAGGSNRMPAIQENYLQLIAEDGNLYNYLKKEYAPVLAAGKTLDAMLDLTGKGVGYYPLYDRRLGLTNAGSFPGGMLTFLASWNPVTVNCSPFKGDMNSDGQISVGDALLALRTVAASGYEPKGDVTPLSNGLPCGKSTGPTTGSAPLAVSDALFILQKAVGLNPY